MFFFEFLINTAPHSGLFFRKELFFRIFRISVNTIFKCSYLVFGWEMDHPLRTYATGGMEGKGRRGGVIPNVYRCVQGKGVEKSVIRYVPTKWVVPKKCCGIFFVHWFGQVHERITASNKNVVVFFHHNYNYFILCDNYNLVSFFYTRIST